MIITSKENPQVKALKRLIQQPKRGDSAMLVEGVHACQLLLQQQAKHHLRINRVWVGERALLEREIQQLLFQVQQFDVAVVELSDAVFRDVSGLAQGVSIVFEVDKPQHQPTEDAQGNVVLLDGIQDPGNMGSILRSCAAAGVVHVWLSAQCVNPYSPKVLRAGVGAHFGLQICEQVDLLAVLKQLKALNYTVCATSSHSRCSIYECDLAHPVAWLMGNEGAGLRAEILAQADEQLSIPMSVGESLNVAAATAVCLFEMLRQQRSA